MEPTTEYHEVLEFPDGKLNVTARRRTDRPNDDFPNEPYIWIDYFRAEPRGRRLLQCYTSDVVAHIRHKLGRDGVIIFAPAESSDLTSQKHLEHYYLSCGFSWYCGGNYLMSVSTPITAKN